MTFSDYIKDGFQDVHLAGGFEHSSEVLPVLPADASDDAKAARSEKAHEIAVAIGAKFDVEYAEPSQQVMSAIAEMQQYWTAPVPFGALPTPPPPELYQQQATALNRCVEICRAYDADARKLAEAGAPKLKEYIDLLLKDASAALQTCSKLLAQASAISPPGYNAAPGPMMLGPFGQYVPMDPTAGAGPIFPMPFGGPGPFTPAPFGGPFGAPAMPFAPSPPFAGMAPCPTMPMGGALTPEQQKIVSDSQREVAAIYAETNRKTRESYDRTNKMVSDYLKS